MNHAETVLYTHLTEVDSLDVLSREGFSTPVMREVIPTELGRDLVDWALNYYFENGRKVAPTREAIQETWGDEMERVDISLGDDTETDSIEWSIAQLRAHFAQWKSQEFVKNFAMSVAKAGPTEKVSTVQQASYDLYRLSQSLVSRQQKSTLQEGVEDALSRYQARAEANQIMQGLTFGLPLIDQHTMGIHSGEIAVVAAGSAVGKSWVAAKTLYSEWKSGRQAMLVTLENELAMCFDRLICLGAGVSYGRWQQGQANEQELFRVQEMIKNVKESGLEPIIVMPQRGERTMVSMVRSAFSHGVDSLIIDQLTFVDQNPGSKAFKKYEQIGEKIHELHALLTEGAERIPCLLVHQIKREGLKDAQRTGRFEMTDMADGADVERTASFVFGIFQSKMDKIMNRAVWQTLKARRVPPADWNMAWELEFGHIKALSVVKPDDE